MWFGHPKGMMLSLTLRSNNSFENSVSQTWQSNQTPSLAWDLGRTSDNSGLLEKMTHWLTALRKATEVGEACLVSEWTSNGWEKGILAILPQRKSYPQVSLHTMGPRNTMQGKKLVLAKQEFSIQLWLFSGCLWEGCRQSLETGLLAKSTVSQGPGLSGTDFRKELRKGSFQDEKTDFGTRDGWTYWLHRRTVHCSLMRKAQRKACGQQSCRAQHAKEIHGARDSQKPTLVRSKVPAEQLPRLRREEFQKTDNGTCTLFPGASSNTQSPIVLNHHFSTKCTGKSLKISFNGRLQPAFPTTQNTALLLGPEKVSIAHV